MDTKTTPRKRDVNFTTQEKVLLVQLVKTKPILESKATDGKTVTKKQAAWNAVARAFNSHPGVNKRETATLKRAWDNMKAWTRKNGTQIGNLLQSDGPPKTQSCDDASINMVVEAAPTMVTDIESNFDNDDSVLSMNSKDGTNDSQAINEDEFYGTETEETAMVTIQQDSPDIHINTGQANNKECGTSKTSDYIRREALLRIRHLEHKKLMEAQILQTQLEAEEARKRAALLEEERNKILLELAKAQFRKTMASDNAY